VDVPSRSLGRVTASS